MPTFWLLGVVLPWSQVCSYLCKSLLSVLLESSPAGEFLDPMAVLSSAPLQQLPLFPSSPATHEGPPRTTCSPALLRSFTRCGARTCDAVGRVRSPAAPFSEVAAAVSWRDTCPVLAGPFADCALPNSPSASLFPRWSFKIKLH